MVFQFKELLNYKGAFDRGLIGLTTILAAPTLLNALFICH